MPLDSFFGKMPDFQVVLAKTEKMGGKRVPGDFLNLLRRKGKIPEDLFFFPLPAFDIAVPYEKKVGVTSCDVFCRWMTVEVVNKDRLSLIPEEERASFTQGRPERGGKRCCS